MLTNIRKAAFAAMICLLVCYGTPKLAQLIEIQVSSMEIVKNSFIEKLYDYSFLAIIIYISFLIIYYLNEFNRLEAKLQLAFQNGEESTANASDRSLIYRNEFQKEKLEKVYAQIVEFIEENKPYKDPDFSVAALSKDMNINATYLSKALNDHAGKKFRDFINEYRINHIVKQFNEKAHQKFTIEHLYLEAGFVQQSTFNRVFKKHTGYTPSQYIEILEK